MFTLLLLFLVSTLSFIASKFFIHRLITPKSSSFHFPISLTFSLANSILLLFISIASYKSDLDNLLLVFLINLFALTIAFLVPYLIIDSFISSFPKKMFIFIIYVIAFLQIPTLFMDRLPLFASIKFAIALISIVLSAFLTSFGAVQYFFVYIYYPLNSGLYLIRLHHQYLTSN